MPRLISCAVALLWVAGLVAQTPSSGQRFRSGVEVVTLDVSVLDSQRRPVRGLTAADFVVLEDGVEQQIDSFTEVALPAPAPPPAGWWNDVADDVKTSTAADTGRLLLMVIDEAHIPLNKTAIVKKIGHEIVDRMAPGDRMALVYTQKNGYSQDFTDEPRLIREAVERFIPGGEGVGFGSSPGRPTGNVDDIDNSAQGSGCAYFTRQTLDTIEKAAAYASALPGRRKAMFLVSELGAPTNPDSPCYLDGLDIWREAQRGNVNIYPISPSAMEAGFDIGSSTADEATATRDQAVELRDGLRTLADNTGGFAIVSTNDFARGVEQVYTENGSYYLIGYSSSSTKDRGKFRDIEVTVRRPGLEVRARDGYVPPKASKAADTPDEPERAVITGFLPSSDLVMSATVLPMRGPSRDDRTALAAVVEVRPPVGDQPVNEKVSIEAVLFDSDGKSKDRMRTEIPVTITPRPGLIAAYRVPFVLHAKPGRYQLRVGAASAASGKAGSVYYDLTVPEYGDDPLELSGLALFARADAPSVKPDALAPAWPLTPTLRRTFGPAEAVRAGIRVYTRGDGPRVIVQATLTGSAGDVWTEQLSPETVERDGAFVVFNLPLGELAAGPYRLAITATRGDKSATRVTRFVVQ